MARSVAKTAASTLAIGIFHYVFRKRFLAISMDAKAVAARGVSVRFWDFLFYASFGFVVTRRWRSPACCWCSAT